MARSRFAIVTSLRANRSPDFALDRLRPGICDGITRIDYYASLKHLSELLPQQLWFSQERQDTPSQVVLVSRRNGPR